MWSHGGAPGVYRGDTGEQGDEVANVYMTFLIELLFTIVIHKEF